MKKRAAAVLAAVCAVTLCLGGCGINQKATLVNVNDNECTITLGYGNFVAKYYQAIYENAYGSYYDDMWNQDLYGSGNTFQEDLKADILDSLQEEYLLKQHAADYGVELSEEETKAIKDAAKKFMENNTDQAIKDMGATEEYLIDMLTYETYAQKVSEAIREKAELTVTEEEAKVRTFSYVCFSTADAEDDDAKMALKAQAQAVSEQNDFELSVSALGQTVEEYSYYPADTGMDEAVLSAADQLKKGEISGVIEVEDEGYYVIRLDSEYDEEASAEKLVELQEEQKNQYLQDVLAGWKEDMSWEVDKDQWAKVTFDQPFAIVESESEE